MINWDVVSTFLFEQDFRGQKKAERLYQGLIISFSLIGFFAGYIQQSFKITFQFWVVGMVLAAALCIPGWCCLRRSKVDWLKSVEDPLPPPSAPILGEKKKEGLSSAATISSSANGDHPRSSSRSGAQKRR
jgi:signal peptidase complex subunit 1